MRVSVSRTSQSPEPPAKPKGDQTGPLSTGAEEWVQRLATSTLSLQQRSLNNSRVGSADIAFTRSQNGPETRSLNHSRSGPLVHITSTKKHLASLEQQCQDVLTRFGVKAKSPVDLEGLHVELQARITQTQAEFQQLEREIARLTTVQATNRTTLERLHQELGPPVTGQTSSAEGAQTMQEEDLRTNTRLRAELESLHGQLPSRLATRMRRLENTATTVLQEEGAQLPQHYRLNPGHLRRSLRMYIGWMTDRLAQG